MSRISGPSLELLYPLLMSRKILIVDDTPDLLLNIKEFLIMEDYEVRTATNGLQALEALESNEALPDIIITDIVMPRMDGLEFIQEMRKQERFNTIPVIVFSAKPVQESQDRISQLRVDKFVMKPSTLDCLLESIEELLNS